MILPWLDPVRDRLTASLSAGRLGHAPLIHGPAGIGKRHLAEQLARLLLCLSPSDGQACGDCRACRLLDAGTHPDRVNVAVEEDRSAITVDQIRDLAARLQLTASVGQRRVAVIHAADAMNVNAANARLKTLEEPPPGVWIVSYCETAARLPATIRSRCQRVEIRLPPGEQAGRWLAEQCPKHSDARRALALRLVDGAPLAARKLLENDEIETGLTVLRDLACTENHQAILERWQVDPVGTWRWLARWLALIMRHMTCPDDSLDHDVQALLPRAVDQRQLGALWQQAIEGGREAGRGVVRQDLLLGKWLLEWAAAIRLQD